MSFNNRMNVTSFLFLLVFMAIGYVIHPLVLPKLQDSGLVAKTKVEDAETEKKSEKKKDEGRKEAANNAVKKRVVPVTPVKPTPVKPTPVTPEPAPAVVDNTPKVTPDTPLTDAEFLKVMQDAVRNGSVSEFRYNQVVDWRRVGEQEIDGEKYDVGIVVYKSSSVFGDMNVEAKVLIQKRKVVKWLWAETNTLMR